MEDRIEKLLQLSIHGSFTRAAAAMHISQPALSMAIRELERELDVKLVEVAGRQVQITPAGQVVLETARRQRQLRQDLERDLRELDKDAAFSLRLGMIDGVAESLITRPETLELLGRAKDSRLVVDRSSVLVESVRDADLDAAVLIEQARPLSKSLAQTAFAKRVLVCVAPPGLPKSDPLPFIAYNTGSNTAKLVERHLAEKNISYSTVLSSTSPQLMLEFCLNGTGFSALPYELARTHLKSRQLERVFADNRSQIELPLALLTRGDTHLHPRTQQIIDDLQQALDDTYRQARTALKS